MIKRILFAGLLTFFWLQTSTAAEFMLKDGDRVVLIGSTLIEREQRYGYWETMFIRSFPQQNITFRNLGWSGDTVWGDARAGFDTAKEGYQRLVAKTLEQKPTIILIGYGTNESFAGAAGVASFRDQLNRLLDDLQPTHARIVLLAPFPFERSQWRAPRYEEHVRDLKLYTAAIEEVARERRAGFVQLQFEGPDGKVPLTEDGMHLSAYGYWTTASNLAIRLDLFNSVGSEVIELDGLASKTSQLQKLPLPPSPGTVPAEHWDSDVTASKLKGGRYTLLIDGRAAVTADASEFGGKGSVTVYKGPLLDQSEKLRQTIVEKNRLFFNRWRPQNETYLFGFRKHEQGQNAREIPQFDPLVERLEKEIFRLRKPVPHTYQLVPAEEGKK